MSTGFATLTVASPTEVARGLADQGAYHWGVPEGHLEVLPFSPGVNVPYLKQDGLLKPGDKYIDTLDNWMDFLSFSGQPAGLISTFAAALSEARKAKFAFTLFGYIPLVLKIPREEIMAYSPHGKIVLRGEFISTANQVLEEWSCSMSYDVVGPDVGAMPNTIGTDALEDIADAWRACYIGSMGGGGAGFPSRSRLTEVAYWRAKTDGKSTTGSWERYFLPSPAVGVGAATQMPLQIATVVTLDAGGPRGGRFGRFYLPMIAAPLENFRYPADVPGNVSGRVVTALTAVNGVLSGVVGDDVELVVASGRGSGENRPVREVRVGDVPDTMRSRRESLAEIYNVRPFQSI